VVINAKRIMPDDYHNNPENEANLNKDDSDASPSAIFIEMMRQAAARRGDDTPATASTSPLQPAPPDAPVEPYPFPVERSGTQAQTPEPAAAREETPAEAKRREALLEAHRIRRLNRRKERRRYRAVGTIGSFIRTMIVVVLASGLASTIFTWFTDPSFIRPDVVSGLQVAAATIEATQQPTIIPTPNWLRRIGIVSGHRGPENDPGAVCPDGLTETEINFNVAQRVVRNLRQLGYSVDLLDEFDPRLDEYQAAALVSIHANSCEDYGEPVSGYLVAKADARPEGGPDSILAECIALHYEQTTQLERRFSLTLDMTDYHNFREIHPLTPAAIIEMGFMKDDRALLTEQPDDLARGITDGILCFLQPGPDGLPVPVATPTLTPIPVDASG